MRKELLAEFIYLSSETNQKDIVIKKKHPRILSLIRSMHSRMIFFFFSLFGMASFFYWFE